MGTNQPDSLPYPPASWGVKRIESAFRSHPRKFPIPPYTDSEAWNRLRHHDRTADRVETVIERAETIRDDGVPELPASTFVEYFRSGRRPPWEDPALQRLTNIRTLTTAECLDRSGTYLDAILDHAWAVCDEATWVMHALLPEEHRVEGLPIHVPVEDREIGLRSSSVAQVLAETVFLLGEQLHPAARQRIERAIERRVLRPYEARDDHWWLEPETMPNQNAVNHFGVLSAAMYQIDDPERLARIIEKGVTSLQHYLAGFHEDGGTNEGVDYWNYGFSHYAKLAAELSTRTAGDLSLLSPPIVNEIARFPLRVELSPGRYPAFSDAREQFWINPAAAAILGEQLDIHGMRKLAIRSFEENQTTDPRSLHLIHEINLQDTEWTPPKRWFFHGIEWWVSRADPTDENGLVVAAKAGHNGESHNHNDCGSLVVHTNGESFLTDLGRVTYHAGLAGEQRYEHLPVRSLGHPVPYVNGFEQGAGAEFAASVIDVTESSQTDTIEMDLAGCYPTAAEIDTLNRRIVLDREVPEVTIDDRAEFNDVAQGTEFVSVLTSFAPMERTTEGVAIVGDTGTMEIGITGGDGIDIEYLEDAMEVAGHFTLEEEYRDVHRARIFAKETGGSERRVTVSMTP